MTSTEKMNGKASPDHITLQLDSDVKAIPSAVNRVHTHADLLRTVDKNNQIIVDFTDICAFVPILFTPQSAPSALSPSSLLKCQPCLNLLPCGPSSDSSGPPERQVLFNVSGCVNPGEVLALMGPSGSGKSSLLAILGGRSNARTTGSVTFNGQTLSKPIKRKLGYVMQDDLLFAELTVYETLYYAALLRLPRSWSTEDKVARVEMVLEGLGLGKCRDTIIGNHQMRGVSGGERKRVSIGHELLINPSVLLLDEPTSGLDSTTALRLLHTMRTLASGGRTIITSIHQPSSRLYQQMDKLMLLSEGQLMYYGHAQLAVRWFEAAGQACPYGTNIADHILDLANGDMARPDSGVSGASSSHSSESADDVVDEDDKVAAVQAHKSLIQRFQARAADLGKMGLQAHNLDTPAPQAPAVATLPSITARNPPTTALTSADKWGASWFDQVKILTVRSIKTRRFQALSGQKVAQLLVVAVLSGLFWWQIGQDGPLDEQAVLDIGGLLFFIQLFMAFAAMFAALFTFPAEFQLLVKERQSGMYRLSAYYIARTLSDLPMDCLLPTLFTWIVYWMTGLRINAGAFFCNWLAVILIMLTAQSLGLLIGGTVMNPQSAQTIATIFMLAAMLVGGYYVRGIPVWIAWLKYVSFIYWGWNLLLKIEFRTRYFPCYNIDPQPATPALADGGCTVQQADIFDLDLQQSVMRDVLVLLAMLIATRVAIYYTLKYKTTFKARPRGCWGGLWDLVSFKSCRK